MIHRSGAVVRPERFALALVLVLALFVALIPHQGYPYPVHLDEWTSLGFSQALVEEGRAPSLTDPFSGSWPAPNQMLEMGYHIFLAEFEQVTGVSWLSIFEYMPALIFVFTVLAVYVLGRRRGFGLEAAFFAALMPTTVGILGPAFMVPMAVGLLLAALGLFVAFDIRGWPAYLMLFVLVVSLLSIHAATAVGLITILVPFVVLNLNSDIKHSLGILAATTLPFLIALAVLPWMITMLIVPTLKALLTPQAIATFVAVPDILRTFGYVPLACCLVGVVLLLRSNRQDQGLAFGLVLVAVLLAVFHRLHYGIETMYYRGLSYVMLLMSIVAGAGLAWVRSIRLPPQLAARWPVHLPAAVHFGVMACLTIAGITLLLAIPARQSTPYYHMMDNSDYAAFVWIRRYVPETFEKGILDPWKGSAFTPISGRQVYTKIGGTLGPTDALARSFLWDGCRTTSFLIQNGISIVYSREPVNNPDLIEVADGVYLLANQ